MSQGCLYHVCSKEGKVETLGWGWIHTIPCSLQCASLLGQKPLFVGAGQDIHGDAVVLIQRAEIDHNILHLLVSQRDSNLEREEKSPKWRGSSPNILSGRPRPGQTSPTFRFGFIHSHSQLASKVPATGAQSPFLALNICCTFSPSTFTQMFPFWCLKNSYPFFKTQSRYAIIFVDSVTSYSGLIPISMPAFSWRIWRRISHIHHPCLWGTCKLPFTEGK